MTQSPRSRREWRIIFWVSLICAAVSGWFGVRVGGSDAPIWYSALTGVVTSLLIATPILLLQMKGNRVAAWRRVQRMPLAAYFAIKLLFYVVVIVGGLTLSRYLFSWSDSVRGIGPSLVFSIAMAAFGNLAFDMIGLIGLGTLGRLVTGRYARPRAEQRTFLLIDMKDSTGLAERLGPLRFHELLNHFFRDVADAALECQGSIHKYVGDEAILTWENGHGIADGACLACPFLVAEIVDRNAARYIERFGAVPMFRAALHCGEIVAGEIGATRREIAYVGDTLNVAARLLDASKTRGHDVLISSDLVGRTTLPPSLKVVPLPMLDVRGRKEPLAIAALERVT